MQPLKKVKKIFQPVKGAFDILPQDQSLWSLIRKKATDLATFYKFERLDTPILEDRDLFTAGSGLSTDIVEKQMYSLKTKGGDRLVLRPEETPPLIRAYLSNGMINLPHPLKIFYEGPMFRYEQPQANRFRQFHQFGLEIIGEDNAVADVQIINLFYNILDELKIRKVVIQINSIGCLECRPPYRSKLLMYYRPRFKQLCKDCKRRFSMNPLRLLDCKDKRCEELKTGAPHLVDQLCDACHEHFKSLLEFLDELELPYILNPKLVRGLDYYTRTVFEFYEETEDEIKSQDALLSGGRYDNLVEVLGGKPTPAVGGAAGFERLINVLRKMDIKPPMPPVTEVFIVQLGDLARRKSLKLFEDLRRSGIKVAESLGRDSIKSQLRIADKSGALISLILGQKEAIDNTIMLREMSTGFQETFSTDKIIAVIKKRLKKLKKLPKIS